MTGASGKPHRRVRLAIFTLSFQGLPTAATRIIPERPSDVSGTLPMQSSITRAAASERRRDNGVLAVLSLCGGVGLASSMDAIFKWMSGSYPLHQLFAFRCAAAVPILILILRLAGGPVRLTHPLWPGILLRGLIMCSAYLAFVMAIAAMPIADVVAIYFTLPLFVAALSSPFLGERVPPHRWIAIVAGFAGVLVMIRPGSGVFEPAALLALYSAFGYALGQMMTRKLGLTVKPTVLAFHQNSIYLTAALALSAVFGGGAFADEAHPSLAFLLRGWAWPGPSDLAIMVGLGLLSAGAMVFFSQAYRLAEPNLVAPFEYTAMFWAVLYGIVLFGDFPDRTTAVGAALVIGGGLYMIYRDRRLAA